jgi:hypothetical protein
MLKEILVVSGKPGLFRLVSKAKNMLVIESLADRKRGPAYARDKVISLADITVYTEGDGDISLKEILHSIKEKEKGGNVSLDLSKAQPDELKAYFAEVLPEFDRERVYTSDIKKILKWYDTLIANGITEFLEKEEEESEKPEEEEKTENVESTEEKQEPVKAKTSSKTTSKRKDETKPVAAKTPKATKPKATTKTAVAPRKSTVGTKRGG